MEPVLKHRLIGAAVLSALAIIFLPKLIVGKDPDQTAAQVPLKAPAAPKGQFDTQELPLDAPSPSVPAGGVVGMNASHPAATPASPATASAASDAGVVAAASPASPALPASPAVGAGQPAPVAAASPAASGKAPVPAASAASPAATVSLAASPATDSTAIPAAQSGGRYVVSLGTYSNAGNAQALVTSLKGKGLPAYADAVSMAGGKPGTRVRIGPFGQRGDAEAARLRAQQIRTDMPANVVALDAATPAAEVPTSVVSPKLNPASSNKPAAVASGKNSAASPVSDKNALPSPAAAGRGYAVQVSAFATENDANALREKLHAAGFVAFVQKIHAESGTRWRVRVGPEADKAAADRLRSQLSTKMNLSGMVVDYP